MKLLKRFINWWLFTPRKTFSEKHPDFPMYFSVVCLLLVMCRGRSPKKNLKKSLRQMNFTDASGTGTRNITKQKRKQGHCNLLSNVIITLR